MAHSEIELDFADGRYLFKLPLPQLDELQRKCGVGIGKLYGRLRQGCVQDPATREINLLPAMAEFYALDVIEPIRQGLIGGNHGIVDGKEIAVTPTLANKLIDNYVMGQPLVENWKFAFSIVGACVLGFDPPKKAEPAAAPAPRRKTRKKVA
jgi:hypothetical protein